MNQFSITHSFVYTFRILLGIIFSLALYIIRILLLLYLGRFLISFFFKYFFIRYISYYRIYLMIVCWVFSIERMWRKTKELSGFFPVFIVPWSWDVPVMAVSWLRRALFFSLLQREIMVQLAFSLPLHAIIVAPFVKQSFETIYSSNSL